MVQSTQDFNAIRIRLASPEQIRSWSYGEVTKPETINYRTLRPERDGLFDERIFGPTKDWECFCGKYKGIRYRGVRCERCGVEVTRSKVRRERMGHIELAAPVAHIWFSKGVPSRIGLLLDLSPRNLERVLYFNQYIITRVNEEARQKALRDLEEEREKRLALLASQGVEEKERAGVEQELEVQREDLEDLKTGKLLTESRYRDLSDRYPEVFTARMGAEAILELLQGLDLEHLAQDLRREMESPSAQRRKKALKRLRVVKAFLESGNRPEWMILTVLPVLPPELRPMVPLDGGRWATSDLNDHYRRVINRNNRLKRLLELGAPEIIIRNEKRMLQEAVDALLDNSRLGSKALADSRGRPLKSLSDLLSGKQGRFRQNLLGKRVDYSGRSVIVVGPELALHQCGLPKRMALELFRPFVMHRLVMKGLAPHIKAAKKMVERARPEVWDTLEEVVKDRPVLLNRAPTLHRLSIQAFMPVLIEGSAIQIHPLVCTAYNADFDGDQMAVHVPLSRRAVLEAKRLMLSTYNLLSPASGEPIVAPTLDIVMGCYWLTQEDPGAEGRGRKFSSPEEAMLAHSLGYVHLQAPVEVRLDGKVVKTTVGRLLLREALPEELREEGVWNRQMDKKALKNLVALLYRRLGPEGTSSVLDKIKNLGFHYATVSGITLGLEDVAVPPEKAQIIREAEERLQEVEEQYQMGLLTEDERYRKTLEVWEEATERVTRMVEKNLLGLGGIGIMVDSGAKGNITQVRQMAGMRGLMSDPKGRLIDVPVKGGLREGLSMLEYFISTHGARKGLADTALRTADSGYLTRRMVDVAQDVIVLQDDCGTTRGVWLRHDEEKERNNFIAPFVERLVGRLAAEEVKDPATGQVLVARNEEIDEEKAQRLWDAGVRQVSVRSPLSCEAPRGVCRLCYGRMLASGRLVYLGEAVGIMAAQSIGEPGTQLTMRTFHTGGVAGIDITSGIPRVESLFEARSPKPEEKALLAEIDGEVVVDEIVDEEGERRERKGWLIRIISREENREEYALPKGYRLLIQPGEMVREGTALAVPEGEGTPLRASITGRVEVDRDRVSVVEEVVEERVYQAPPTATLLVKTGDRVRAGQELTSGIKDPHDILRILGKEAVQEYILEEVQKVYRSQGVTINDKHIEIIVRQMLRRVRVDYPGDTRFLPGDLVDRFTFLEENKKVVAQGGEPAQATDVLLGITRAALKTESFLAAASFQETTRVLTEAAIQGETDRLYGLKENVIIGRLIPARLDLSEEGRHLLGLDKEPTPVFPAPQPEEGLPSPFKSQEGEEVPF